MTMPDTPSKHDTAIERAARELNRRHGAAPLTAEQRHAYEERAAIMEYDGGLPRGEAEYLAREKAAKTT